MTNIVASSLGVDISKNSLDVCLLPGNVAQQFANDSSGIRSLKRWIKDIAPDRIIFEATGAFHRALEQSLQGLPFVKLNPARVKAFGRALGQNAKTDQLDARLLAACGLALETKVQPVKGLEMQNLEYLQSERRGLLREQTMLKNRSKILIGRAKVRNAQRLKLVEKQLGEVEAESKAIVKNSPLMKRKLEVLTSIPGIGEITAIALLSLLPELGTLTNSAMASLAGLAPITRQSGTWKGRSFISGGRKPVRVALYMPAIVSTRFNPDFKILYERLIADGKPAKVAFTAVMRKMVILANVLLAKNRNWTNLPT